MSKLRLRIFDGTRQLFAKPANFLITIIDGNQKQWVRDYYTRNDITFDLPFHDNNGDNFRVIVWAEGYRQAGFVPVPLSDAYVRTLDIMLVANDPGFSFVNARWAEAKSAYPFLAAGAATEAEAEARYEALFESEEPLACLLNLVEAMSQINLAQGTPLQYIKQIRWEAPFSPAKDRFFAWCDAALVDQIRQAAAAKHFAVENGPGIFHPGATNSWKQIDFGEANVQLTFHENEKLTIEGVECVMVEPDMDYFRDLAAHALVEVLVNGLTHSLTNPIEVYILRWIAGQTLGIPEFAPLYTII